MRLLLLLLLLPCACREAQVRASPPNLPDRTLSEGFQRGVNYAHVHSRGHGYGSEASARELDWLAAMGVTHIAITPFGYQHGATADRLAGWDSVGDRFVPRDGSMSDASLRNEIAAAHARGIAVTIKPQIWSHDFWNGLEWHGSVRQREGREHETWWRSYRAFALHYARLASDAGAETYCVGVELVQVSVRYPDEWRSLIAETRSFYKGALTYAAHWDREPEAIGFWDDLDAIGVNAYFPLNVPDTAGVDALVAAWRPYADRLSLLSRAGQRPIVFLEAGYRPVRGTFREPWRYDGGEVDLSVQARGYEAMFRALHDSTWFLGVYLWKAFTDPDRASQFGEDMGFTFRRRPAEMVVRRWYGGGREREHGPEGRCYGVPWEVR